MKTTKLSAEQAYNRLLTGMASYFEYDGETYENVYFIHEGRVYSQYHEDIAELRPQPLYSSTFKIVNIPTFALVKNINGVKEPFKEHEEPHI